mgnify:CR=1 FL=1
MQEGVKHNLDRDHYQIDKANNCILFLGEQNIKHEEILLITNITTNDIIYNPFCDGLGGTLTTAGKLILEKTLSTETLDSDDLIVVIQHSIYLTGKYKDERKVNETNSHLLKEILVQLKINNEHLSEITGNKVREDDVEIRN